MLSTLQNRKRAIGGLPTVRPLSCVSVPLVTFSTDQ